MMKLSRAKKNRPCPICGNVGWCSFSPDGAIVYCNNVSHGSFHTTATGSHMHRLIEREPQPSQFSRPLSAASKTVLLSDKPKVGRPSDEHLNDVYTALFDELILNEHHAQSLKIRGLSDLMIHAHGYRSAPKPFNARRIAIKLSRSFALERVPGFYFEKDCWHFQTYFASGFLIPIRNYKHQIVGLILRRDDGRKPKYMMISSAEKPKGASSGAPAHFALLGGTFKRPSVTEIVVTEGALKANVAAFYLQQPVIGLVGTGGFKESFPEILKEAFPHLRRIAIAYDMDARTNDQVLAQRDRLFDLLKESFITEGMTWDTGHKGLDDYLLYQSKRGGIRTA